MKLMDIPSELLQPVHISKKMFLKALTNSKPTVGKDDLEQYERWTKTYGQEG